MQNMRSISLLNIFRPLRARTVSRTAFPAVGLNTEKPQTLFDKVWNSHVISQEEDGTCLIYIDRHLVHEVTSPQAFESLSLNNRDVRQKKRTLLTPDHNVSTAKGRSMKKFADQASKDQVLALDSNAKKFGLPYFPLTDSRQGIVHIIGPEQGFVLPGLTVVCGDSHTSTHGAFGSLAFGIGTSEVEHVLATQTLIQKPAKNLRINLTGELGVGVTSKDVVLKIIGEIGTAGGTQHVIEFAGPIIEKMSMEGRMTICNMAIEAGARAGMIAPDQVTFDYLKGRNMAPKDKIWDKAVEYWSTLKSDPDAYFDKEVTIDGEDIPPQVTWGTNPEMVAPITGSVPKADVLNESSKRALEYMGLEPGQDLDSVEIDKVFVGSCTNGRIEDLRELASVVRGKKIHPKVKAAMVVPGSGLVKKQAEEEGLDAILIDAGFDWRQPGCSMCLGMNEDQLEEYERCASTSNRNFEGRQGKKGRTHLLSPAMAGAAAITGRLTDVRKLSRGFSTARPQKREFSTGMQPFTTVKGVAAALPLDNIDTDMIIPALYLKTIKRTGLGKFAFAEMRYNENGEEVDSFVLNQQPFRGSKIIVAGDNFGCGSSREHAPWALLDFGIRCVISTSFADIFYNNCFKNGILPIKLDQSEVDKVMVEAKAGKEVEVNLESQMISLPTGEQIEFDVEEFRKYCLVNGLDDIGLTLNKLTQIENYEEWRQKVHPWV
eukprot:maker-scaffold_5-snap-gene-13.6-mRNA-1 protein AED:0.01 eAED:0.01 QI:333/1/1/1/1/1/3/303/713